MSEFDEILDGPPPNVEELTGRGMTSSVPKKAITLSSNVDLATMKPVVAQVIAEALKLFETDKDDFTLAEEFVNTDPVVGGNADALSLLVQKAYRGPRIRPRASDKDKPNSAKNKADVLAKADEILYGIDFKGILSSASINMFQDGDVVIWIRPNLTFMFLPRKYVTGLPAEYVSEKDGVLVSNYNPTMVKGNEIITADGAGQALITSIDYYILNEGTQSEIVIPKEEILHIKYNPHGRMTTDQRGRSCFNIWSVSPVSRLKKTLLWKANAIVNDILWRDAMPPREHHKLDLSMFSPDVYDGESPEERVAAARTAALGVIRDYIKFITHKEVDVGYVTDLITQIEILESKAHTYASPNELLRQLDENVHATSGVPRSAMYGEGSAAYASELLASNYAGLRAEFIGDRISRPFENWLKRYLREVYPKTLSATMIDRIRLKFRLILPRDIREIAQGVNLLMSSMIVDVSQILEAVGLDTMTDDEFTVHLDKLKKMSEAQNAGKLKFGAVDGKGTDDSEASKRRQQEPSTTKAGKELNPDKMGK